MSGGKNMKVTYIHHSSFLVETDENYFLFDYFEGELPEFKEDKPLLVFASHRHGDHFSPVIFELAGKHKKTGFVLSDDIWKRRVSEEFLGKTYFTGPGEELDMSDCLFEIHADNGYYDWNNDLLDDDVISYQPYHLEKVEDVGIVAEMNTMRLLEHKKVYLTLTRKSDGKELMKVDLIPYLLLTKMEGHNIPAQEYLDRQSEYAIVFFYNPELLNFLSTKIVINGWTIWLKGEDL